MKLNQLGNSDIKVSELCLGTMNFGEQNTQDEAFEQMDYSFSQGINFFDTAEMYPVPPRQDTQGSTEVMVGNWMKDRNKRKDIILATKAAGPSRNMDYIAPDLGFSKKRLTVALEKSLERLQTDYIDLYQLHWPERRTNCFSVRGFIQDDDWQDNFEEAIATLQSFIDSGKIRTWGLSNETPWGVLRCKEICVKNGYNLPVSIQNPYNLLNRTYEIGLAEVSYRENIGLLPYSPVAFGRLTNKFHDGSDSDRDRINRYSRMSRYNGENSLKASSLYYNLAQENNLSLAQLAIAFDVSKAFVTSTIIGATTMEQLQENIESIHVTLTSDMVKHIEKIHESIPNPAP